MPNKKGLHIVAASVLLTLTIIWGGGCRPAEDDPVAETLNTLIPGLMERAVVPGVSAALVRCGRTVWTGAFGTANADGGTPLTEDAVFEACSLSKPVFAYAVLRLVDRGLLDLDRPLIEYVPETYLEEVFLKRPIDDDRLRRITGRMALSHRPGFPNWRGRAGLKIRFEPGEKFSYSGEGFVFLQKVVEKLTEKDLNSLMAEEVFRPLGMTGSSYIHTDSLEERLTHPHSSLGTSRPKRRRRTANAAASLITTASDYARFLAAVMDGTGLHSETAAAMLVPQSTVVDGQVMWGLGIGLERTSHGDYFWHWGDNGDFKCFALASRESRTGIVYFANGANGLSIADKIAAEVFPGEHPVFPSPLMDDYLILEGAAMSFIADLKREGAAAAVSAHKRRLEKDPKGATIRERVLNAWGYDLLRGRRFDQAVTLFEFIVELHPKSANAHDSLGEGYAFAGRGDRAAASYRRSLELNSDNDGARIMLAKLGFVPAGFEPPDFPETSGFRLRGLKASDAEADFELVTSSRENLWRRFEDERWPPSDLTLDRHRRDLERRQDEFDRGWAYSFAVVSDTDGRILGRVHIEPSRKAGNDAQVFFWIRDGAGAADLEKALETSLRTWLRAGWPFAKIAWPGLEIAWEEWRKD